MSEQIEHEQCEHWLREGMANLGVEITVSTAPPIIETPYTLAAMRCPHGTDFWLEPTSEQIAAWTRDGVA